MVLDFYLLIINFWWTALPFKKMFYCCSTTVFCLLPPPHRGWCQTHGDCDWQSQSDCDWSLMGPGNNLNWSPPSAFTAWKRQIFLLMLINSLKVIEFSKAIIWREPIWEKTDAAEHSTQIRRKGLFSSSHCWFLRSICNQSCRKLRNSDF